MRVYKIIIFVLLVIISLFLSYFFHISYVESLNKDSDKLLKYYTSYGINYFDFVPEEKQDMENFLEWTERVTEIPDLGFLKNGYNIKYDSISKSSLIYSFGRDGIDNGLAYTPLNDGFEDIKGQYRIRQIRFFNYLKNMFKQKDVILAKIDALEFQCDVVLSNINNRRPYINYELYNGSETLWLDDNNGNKNLFLKSIRQFKNEYNKSFIIKNGSVEKTRRILYFKYKHGKIETLCPNNIEAKKLLEIESILEEFFKRTDTSYFDYAVFSLSLNFEKN